MNILFATSEAYPLIKTGGLADVSGSLPRAMLQLEQDIRIILPAYQSILDKLKTPEIIGQCHHYGYDIRLLKTILPDSKVIVYLVDCPAMFARPGNPYLNAIGEEWQDNALRFALFNQVIVDVALNRLAFDWPVDLVHCNDWQSGLTPALLDQFKKRPATVFTIHNLAYQGIYPKQSYFDLGLPDVLWNFQGLEFHDLFSFIKGGLNFADCINAVSPQYAKEIQTAHFGYGLQDLLQFRSDRLSGILNGIDTDEWNPGTDDYLVAKYNSQSLEKKRVNKADIQQKFGLSHDVSMPIFGLISRLVEQKGIDLILQALPELVKLPLQMVFLGSGQKYYELQLLKWSESYPDKIAVKIGYDEILSHQIEAGCDFFLMPSLFEPCGLNQFYSLRYGTIPVVTRVGGLADSVTDYTYPPEGSTANGFLMQEISSEELYSTIQRALAIYQQADQWKQLQLNAMSIDHSWKSSAMQYLELYKQAISYRDDAIA
jgi:starch synthase